MALTYLLSSYTLWGYMDKLNYVKRINRIKGQVGGIENMIQESRYCLDVLTQIKAARAALNSLESEILKQHLNSCVKEAFESKNRDQSDALVNELSDFFKKRLPS